MPAVRSFLAAVLAAFVLVIAPALAQDWTIEDGSTIRFTAFQQGRPVDGRFDAFTAQITFDPDDLAGSRVEVEIDTASIGTGHKDRDATLRGSSFFDVKQWPRARFESDKLVHVGGDRYEAHGRLTIRDVTRDVVLPFELTIEADPADPDRLLAHANGELTISRLDYGVGQGEWASTSTVGEEVVIAIDVRASLAR